MTVNIAVQKVDRDTGLLACCRHLAQLGGMENFVAELRAAGESFGLQGRKETLKQVMRVARVAGLQIEILRLAQDQLHGLAGFLPVVAELRDGRYVILAEVADGPASQVLFTLLVPGADGRLQEEKLSHHEFLRRAAGGLLRFTRVNTALVCFSLVAREHKIELTRERLLHEYNLGSEEIPKDTLLRMAKEQGLKAKLLSLSWQGLLSLKKAYPAIAVLKNGRHVVLTGIGTREENGVRETFVACYDPLAGSGGGHLRLTREELAAIWSARSMW